ncbi:hypothetical protein RB200_35535 [Streptomyces sp. PmtG]
MDTEPRLQRAAGLRAARHARDHSGSLRDDDTVLGGSLTLSVVPLMIAGVVGALTVCGE